MHTNGKNSGNGQAHTVSGAAASQHTGAASGVGSTSDRAATAGTGPVRENGTVAAQKGGQAGRKTGGHTEPVNGTTSRGTGEAGGKTEKAAQRNAAGGRSATQAQAIQSTSANGDNTAIVNGKRQSPEGKESVENGVDAASVPAADSTDATGSSGEPDGVAEHAAQPFDLILPEGMPVNSAMLDAYRDFCMESGLTQEQAQKAVDFYLTQQSEGLAAERESSLELLRTTLWGGRFEEKIARANHAVRSLDQRMEGRLMPVVEAGLGNNAAFVELMSIVGESISEDSFAAAAGAPFGAPAPMSTEDFLRYEVFNK